MSVNDTRVRKIINDAISKAGNNGDLCCGSIRQAWVNLKRWRDLPPAPGAEPNSLDLDVAAAENYMFARACVCEGFVNRFQMNSVALVYYTTKLMGVDMATSGNPQSEPDVAVLGWGGIGSEEGEADRERCNPNADPPWWRPVSEIMGESDSYYIKVGGAPGTAYSPPAP